jgi:hypothetical protein
MKDHRKLVGTKVQDAELSEKRVLQAVNQMIASVNEQDVHSKKKLAFLPK